ncbi:hypothetical protein [Arthrobacter gengyunqii]|uniref:hypothetical protein n=1 Tax=Arthrobacter gengyunqii TaxID=2886940 RepID=UPI003C2DBF40
MPPMLSVLEGIIAETGVEPKYVRCDERPEFNPGALTYWCATAGRKQRSLTWDDRE